MLKRLCLENKWVAPALWMDSIISGNVQAAVSNLSGQAVVSLRELEGSDFILAIGVDPLNEAPMLALALRQAQRRGAGVVVIDPRPIFLPFEFRHLAISPDLLNLCLGSLTKAAVDRAAAESLGEQAVAFYDALPEVDSPPADQLQDTADGLARSRNPVIVCGTQLVDPTTPPLTAAGVELLLAMRKKGGLFYTLPGANAFGAALLSAEGPTLEQILEGIEDGVVRALVIVETDPFWHFPDRRRLEAAIERLDLLVGLDYISTPASKQAHIFLPTATVYEADGIFINQEGRVQAVSQTYRGGIPISQVSGGGHPPRKYDAGIPGADPRPAWLTLAALAYGESQTDERTLRPQLWEWLAEFNSVFTDLPPIHEIPEQGIRLNIPTDRVGCFSMDGSDQSRQFESGDDKLQLILTDWTFGTEELSSYSPHLRVLEKQPCVFIHSNQVANMKLQDGDKVVIRTENGALEVRLRAVENLAEDVIVLPRHRQLAWQIFESEQIQLPKGQIRKA
jgi:NADH-quinone oxidoreductase subunit G